MLPSDRAELGLYPIMLHLMRASAPGDGRAVTFFLAYFALLSVN